MSSTRPSWRRNDLPSKLRFVSPLQVSLTDSLQVQVIQNVGSPLWDASVALARQVSLQGEKFDTIVEIGAGCALPSIVADKLHLAKRIIATELYDEMPLVMENISVNLSNVEALEYFWGSDVEKVFGSLGNCLILAADVVYEIQHLDSLTTALSDLLNLASSTSKILMAMEHRWSDISNAFWDGIRTRGLVHHQIDQSLLDSRFTHDSIHLYWIQRAPPQPKLIKRNPTVSVVQMTSTNDIQSNLQTISTLLQNCDADFVCFPEATDFIATSPEEARKLCASKQWLRFCSEMKRFAVEYGIYISVGLHRPGPDGRLYNSLWVIDPSGKVIAEYDKLHLFDIYLSEGPTSSESLSESINTIPGSRIVPPISLPFGNVGLCICYDVRFPELSLKLTKLGAEILLYPSAFTPRTGRAQWLTLLKCRAIETQCFVLGAAQVGNHGKRSTWGQACIIDPFGKVLIEAPSFDTCPHPTPMLITHELDLLYQTHLRQAMPVATHRRTDLFPFE
jgi:predicted amidohydrolase